MSDPQLYDCTQMHNYDPNKIVYNALDKMRPQNKILHGNNFSRLLYMKQHGSCHTNMKTMHYVNIAHDKKESAKKRKVCESKARFNTYAYVNEYNIFSNINDLADCNNLENAINVNEDIENIAEIFFHDDPYKKKTIDSAISKMTNLKKIYYEGRHGLSIKNDSIEQICISNISATVTIDAPNLRELYFVRLRDIKIIRVSPKCVFHLYNDLSF